MNDMIEIEMGGRLKGHQDKWTTVLRPATKTTQRIYFMHFSLQYISLYIYMISKLISLQKKNR